MCLACLQTGSAGGSSFGGGCRHFLKQHALHCPHRDVCWPLAHQWTIFGQSAMAAMSKASMMHATPEYTACTCISADRFCAVGGHLGQHVTQHALHAGGMSQQSIVCPGKLLPVGTCGHYTPCPGYKHSVDACIAECTVSSCISADRFCQ